jgi:hypothetical protein
MESDTTPVKVCANALTDRNERLTRDTARSFFMGDLGEIHSWCEVEYSAVGTMWAEIFAGSGAG